MASRWRAGTPAVAVVVMMVLLVSCREAPRADQPVAPSVPQPALTLEQAGPVLAAAHTVAVAADSSLTSRRLPEAFTGFELYRIRTTIALARQGDRKGSNPLAAYSFAPVQMWSSAGDRFPQSALVQSRISGRQHPKAWVLHQLVRTEAGAPWLVTLSLYPDDDPLRLGPRLVDGVTEVLAGADVVNGARLDTTEAALVAALDGPRSRTARTFRGHPRREHFAEVEKHNAEVGEKSLDFSSRPGSTWLPTAGGGAVGLVPLAYTEVLTARPDRSLTLGRGLGRTFPHRYHQVSQLGLVTCLVEVPPQGKISVPHCDSSNGNVTVVRDR